jgi:hypothetical protein
MSTHDSLVKLSRIPCGTIDQEELEFPLCKNEMVCLTMGKLDKTLKCCSAQRYKPNYNIATGFTIQT